VSEQFYQAHLRLYKTQAEEVESWRLAHDEAMACSDIEDAIGLGLSILDNLRRRGGSGAERGNLSWEEASDQARAYRVWLDTTRHLLEGARRLEQAGFVVQRADELRRACGEVSLLPLDTDRIRRSLESLEGGEGVPTSEAIDGLRNRLRPGGA